MFRIIFEFVTEVFGNITGNILLDYFLVALISQLLYPVSYRLVGRLFDSGVIESRAAGSFFHWLIRGIMFIVVVVVVGLLYKAYMFFKGVF
jgi:hypothetical protein